MLVMAVTIVREVTALAMPATPLTLQGLHTARSHKSSTKHRHDANAGVIPQPASRRPATQAHHNVTTRGRYFDCKTRRQFGAYRQTATNSVPYKVGWESNP